MRDAFGNNRSQLAPKAPPAPSRMTLSAVTRGRVKKAPRVLLFGTEGIGKSSWAAHAPAPIFLAVEDGTAQLDVARFPEPQSWTDVLDAIRELATVEHSYKTLVIDTVDALEALCWRHICERDGKKNIEDYGFSKGQRVIAPKEWGLFLAELDKLHRAKNIGIILLAHSQVKTWKNPEGDDFDRYELAVDAKAGGLLKAWPDAVLFARYETFAAKDGKTQRVRGISSGARVVHTTRTAAYDAKNRYDLPETMPLDYDAFAEAVEAHQPEDPKVLRARILGMLETGAANDALRAGVMTALDGAGDDSAQLARIANKLSARLGIAAQQEGHSNG